MSLCLLEFWVPQHEVSSTFTLCMSATGMNKSIMHLWSFVPKGTKLKAVPEPAAKPAPKAAPKPAPKGKHVQLFKMKRKVGKGFYSVPVNQNESD